MPIAIALFVVLAVVGLSLLGTSVWWLGLLILGATGWNAYIQIVIRRQTYLSTTLTPTQAAFVVRKVFSGRTWELGSDGLEFRARNRMKVNGPTIAVDIEPRPSGAAIRTWVSHANFRYGVMEHAQFAWRKMRALEAAAKTAHPATTSGESVLDRSPSINYDETPRTTPPSPPVTPAVTPPPSAPPPSAPPTIAPPTIAPPPLRSQQHGRHEPSDAAASARFIYIESVQQLLPDDQDTFRTVESLSEALWSGRGRGFGDAVVDDTGRFLGPSQFVITHAARRHDLTDTAFAGWPSHHAANLPGGLDLGARDGRNLSRWDDAAPAGLTFPWSQAGRFSDDGEVFAAEFGPSVIAIVPDQHGQLVLLESHGGDRGALVTLDPVAGVRRYVRTFDSLSGAETLDISPDGSWALLSGWSKHRLVRLDDGTVATIGTDGPLAFWTAQGISTLLQIAPGNDCLPHIFSYDVAIDHREDIGPLSGFAGLPDDRRIVADIDVSPDGKLALGLTLLGVSAEHQQRHGGRYLTTIIDLSTRTVDLVSTPFVNGDARLQRDHRAPRWCSRPASRGAIAIADSLIAERSAAGPSSIPSPTDGTLGDRAHDQALILVHAMIGADNDGRHAVPVYRAAIAALIAAANAGIPTGEGTVFDWASRNATVFEARFHGERSSPGSVGNAWATFASVVGAIQSGDGTTLTPAIGWRRNASAEVV
ncbi:hypothetical protein ACQPYH_19675 [Kribbella sp. CA-245084]|uniref:hypothetical protein n=1 Tax=Kribbella sp. CA-245084 TaxID=3239940 RepID=UPI003D91D89C